MELLLVQALMQRSKTGMSKTFARKRRTFKPGRKRNADPILCPCPLSSFGRAGQLSGRHIKIQVPSFVYQEYPGRATSAK